MIGIKGLARKWLRDPLLMGREPCLSQWNLMDQETLGIYQIR
jgi:hypothetical protein